MIIAIEEAKDIAKLSRDELSGYSQVHEARINRPAEKIDKKALQLREGASIAREAERVGARGCGRGSFEEEGEAKGEEEALAKDNTSVVIKSSTIVTRGHIEVTYNTTTVKNSTMWKSSDSSKTRLQ